MIWISKKPGLVNVSIPIVSLSSAGDCTPEDIPPQVDELSGPLPRDIECFLQITLLNDENGRNFDRKKTNLGVQNAPLHRVDPEITENE